MNILNKIYTTIMDSIYPSLRGDLVYCTENLKAYPSYYRTVVLRDSENNPATPKIMDFTTALEESGVTELDLSQCKYSSSRNVLLFFLLSSNENLKSLITPLMHTTTAKERKYFFEAISDCKLTTIEFPTTNEQYTRLNCQEIEDLQKIVSNSTTIEELKFGKGFLFQIASIMEQLTPSAHARELKINYNGAVNIINNTTIMNESDESHTEEEYCSFDDGSSDGIHATTSTSEENLVELAKDS